MLFAPLGGWRHVKGTDRRAAVDYAQVLKDLSDRILHKDRAIDIAKLLDPHVRRGHVMAGGLDGTVDALAQRSCWQVASALVGWPNAPVVLTSTADGPGASEAGL